MKLAVQIKPCCSNRAAQTAQLAKILVAIEGLQAAATILKSKLEKTATENPNG